MKHVTIKAFSVFVEHGRLQLAEVGWEKSLRLRYCAYFVPFHVSLKDVSSSAYSVSFFIQPRAIYSADDNNNIILASNEGP